MEIQSLTGEELCKILNAQYQQLMQVQGNILAIQQELKRREELQNKNEIDEPTVSKENK